MMAKETQNSEIKNGGSTKTDPNAGIDFIC